MENEQMAMEMVQQNEVHEEPKPTKTQTIDVTDVANLEERNPAVVLSNSGFNNITVFKEAFTIGKYFAGSNLVPKAYQNHPMDCAIAVDIANRMNVSPMFVMQNLYVVQGTPSWSGQACMSIIRGCGRYKDVTPVYVGEQGKDNWGCYISATEVKTGKEIRGVTVTIQMAKEEGWYGKSGSKWKTLPQLMMTYRASAFFAKVYCPNELMGFRVEGEAEDIAASKETAKAVDVFAGKE